MFNIHFYFLAVVAAAPYDKKVFSDEFLDKLKKEILEKVISQDAHVTCKLCLLFFLNTSFKYSKKQTIGFILLR